MPENVIRLDSRRRFRGAESGDAPKAGSSGDLWRHPIALDVDLTMKLLRGLTDVLRIPVDDDGGEEFQAHHPVVTDHRLLLIGL